MAHPVTLVADHQDGDPLTMATPNPSAYTAAATAAAAVTSQAATTRQKRNKLLSLFSERKAGTVPAIGPAAAMSVTATGAPSPLRQPSLAPTPVVYVSRAHDEDDDNESDEGGGVPRQIRRHTALYAASSTSQSSCSSFTSSSSTSSSSSSSSSSTVLCPPPLPSMARISRPHIEYAVLDKAFAKFQRKPKQRHEILKQQVLPWFRRQHIGSHDTLSAPGSPHATIPATEPSMTGLWFRHDKEDKETSASRVLLLVRWWRVLLQAVQAISYTERSIYFECIAEIMGRHEFLEYDNAPSVEYADWIEAKGQDTLTRDYRAALMATLRYALDKLNQKAIYSNMISFCAKVLAFGFFKVPGLAAALLGVLSVRLPVLKRLYSEMGSLSDSNVFATLCTQYKERLRTVFPAHLHTYMTWHKQHFFNSTSARKVSPSPVELSGNWIRRWQSDDSELFFSFYRHYHTTLKTYITTAFPAVSRYNLQRRNAVLATSPGYLSLAAHFTSKIDALLHREVHSVTTVFQCADANVTPARFHSAAAAAASAALQSPNKGVAADEDRHQSLVPTFGPNYDPARATHEPSRPQRTQTNSGKPRPLEMATRRYAECMVWCVVMSEPSGLYHDMVNVWVRAAIKKTSLTAVESVFCLLDFVEAIIFELQKCQRKPNHPPMDLPFLLHTLHIMLSRSDHTITLLRALSFIYVHFAFLTPHAALLDLLCNRILLDMSTFERLFLHWGRNVRIFFLRCLIWRVGRVWAHGCVRWNSEAEHMVCMMLADKSIMCDGFRCWTASRNGKPGWGTLLHNTMDASLMVLRRESLVYDRCTLEIHMVMEALLASFHRRHAELQQLLNGIDARGRWDLVSNAHSYTTPVPKRLDHFHSQLASYPSTPWSMTERPRERVHSEASHRRKGPSLFKKRHLFTRSRTGKDSRLLKLFSPSPSNPQHQSDDTDDDEDDDVSQPAQSVGSAVFYTVPSAYSMSSVSLPSLSLASTSSLSSASSNDDSDSVSTSGSCRGEREDSGADIVMRPSLSEPTVSNIGRTDTGATKCESEAGRVKDGSQLQSSPTESPCWDVPAQEPVAAKTPLPLFVSANTLAAARKWRYAPSAHIYATKVLAETKGIMHEYCVWLDKVQDTDAAFVPGLSLDWPKNWTYSQLQ